MPDTTDVQSVPLKDVKRMAIGWLSNALDRAHGRGNHILTINELRWENVTTPERAAIGFDEWGWVVGKEVFTL